ncbi:MAG TPA: hypothetical protein VMY37_06190 [Thermoguttaceae bacterium]|nr:hypothetical protein [Thermoguttaceae bacterium]
MNRRSALTTLLVVAILAVSLGKGAESTDPPEARPRAAYLGCISMHHLIGDTGTSLYRTRGGWRLVNLEYVDKQDPDFWHYSVTTLPDADYYPRWKFAKYPHCCGGYSVYVLMRVSSNTAPVPAWVWRRVEAACRIRAYKP